MPQCHEVTRTGVMTISAEQSLALDVRFDVNNAVICDFAAGSGANSSLSHGNMNLVLRRD